MMALNFLVNLSCCTQFLLPFPTSKSKVRKKQTKKPISLLPKNARERMTCSEWPEEEMPDVEIDIDDLLDAANEEERALKLQEALVDCYKPTEEFIKELLTRIRGMRKLSPPQKKSI
uniref:Protein phosphatase 1 regulatory inhibitor subunit 14C n=1 Tax=Dromaius novaehollandiae TaxID=8790 RepID=A0A8C4KN40_DRONO